MPRRPAKPCRVCKRPTREKSGRCLDCQAAGKGARAGKPEHHRLYDSAAWKQLRKAKLLNSPLCEECEANGYVVAAKDVDHVIPLRERPDLALVIENLRSLCVPCHRRKSARGK